MVDIQFHWMAIPKPKPMELFGGCSTEEKFYPLDIVQESLRKDQLSWLYVLTDTDASSNSSASMQFCCSCCRYLNNAEDVTRHKHQSPLNPHDFSPIVQVHSEDSKPLEAMAQRRNYYVRVRKLMDLRVPVGDVLSHVLPVPHPGAARDDRYRCVYIHRQIPQVPIVHLDAVAGRCAYRECREVMSERRSHLKVFGITPQFCSISCKLNTTLALLRYD